jgi:hypothetical protein
VRATGVFEWKHFGDVDSQVLLGRHAQRVLCDAPRAAGVEACQARYVLRAARPSHDRLLIPRDGATDRYVDPDRLRPKTARSTPPTSNASPEAVAAESRSALSAYSSE